MSSFIACAHDKVYRQRNHPCIAIWCGRNEGNPSDPASGTPGIVGLDDSLRAVTVDHDGTRAYISNSAQNPVSGGGPYELKDPKWYFVNSGSGTLHSEMGVVAPMVYESMNLALGSANLWPINNMWGVHDWTQPRDDTFELQLQNWYGAASGITDFCKKSQCLDFQAVEALFETYQARRGSGVLLWMSHPAWTSLKCQTYDYFGDYTGGFFAAKKACERTHILWNCQTSDVVVANNSRAALSGVLAKAWVYNMDGTQQYSNSATLLVPKDTSVTAFNLNFPAGGLSDIHFVRLKLFKSDGATLLSENFYWRGKTWLNYTSLNALGPASLSVAGGSSATATVSNTGPVTAFFIRLKVLDNTGTRILPVYYDDNYFSLLPGESKTVTLEYQGTGNLVAEPFNGLATTPAVNAGNPAAAYLPRLRTTRSFVECCGLRPGVEISMRLFDALGGQCAVVKHSSGAGIRLETKGLSKGMYVVTVGSGKKQLLTQKILVE